MSVRNSQTSPVTTLHRLASSATLARSAPATGAAAFPNGSAPAGRPEALTLSSEARQPEQASRVGGLMAALEDMARESLEKAPSTNNAAGGGGAGPLAGNGNAGAPNYSDAFAPANTQTVQLEADGRQGLEAALRKAGYSPEETRSGRVLNQILKDNQIDSMNSLKAGSRVSIPSRSQGGGSGSEGSAFQTPGFGGSGNGGGGFSNGGIGGGFPSGGGYQGAFPASPWNRSEPTWNGGAPAWGGTKPVEDKGGAKGGAAVNPQRQNYGDSCGQSSVAMAVNSLTGKNLTDHDIRRKHGYSLLGALNQESRGSGYKWADSDFSRSKWPLLEKKLNEEKTPVLIGLNGPQFSPSGRGHIVTLMSIDGDKVRYADPADGKIKVTTRQAIESAKPHPDGKFLFTASKG